MGIVDELLAAPGLYVGIDSVVGTDLRGAARIVVTPLPGRAAVSLDYEVFNPAMPDRLRGHAEHTIVAKSHDGPAMMVICHTHSEAADVLRETEPGVFEAPAESLPYPMKVVIAVPGPGRLRHSWWYGPAGGEAVERDVSELALEQ